MAVVSILVGLLLAGVQKVRSRADSLRCLDHLRQLVLASHQHHDAVGRFPAGSTAINKPETFLGWQPRLLLWLDQPALASRMIEDFRNDPSSFSDRHAGRSAVLSMVGCQADNRVNTAWTVFHGSYHHASLTSYLGNSGTNSRRHDGILYYDSRIAMQQITDGMSHTLFIGERPPSTDLLLGWWYSGTGIDGKGTIETHMPVRQNWPGYLQECGRGPYPFAASKVTDRCAALHYWSLHLNCANFAFCDGSVRFLAYSADSILPALATRAGGEAPPADW